MTYARHERTLGRLPSGLIGDVRTAVRRFVRRPAAVALPIVILTCGIAISSVVFSVVELVLFRPLPFPQPDRLVAVYAVWDQGGNPSTDRLWNRRPVSWNGWWDLRQQRVFSELGVWSRTRLLLGHPAEDEVETWYVSSSLLTLLGTKAVLGRLLTAEEDHVATSDAVLLTHETWMRRFGGRRDILETDVTLTRFVNEPRTKRVVGVLSPGFRLRGEAPEFILAIGPRIPPAQSLDSPAVNAVGRLRDGVSHDEVRAVAAAVVPRNLNVPDATARIVPLREDVIGQVAPPAWILLVSAALFMLVAMASVAGFFLSEAPTRRYEVGVRMAMGADSRSILRQLVIEHLTMAAAAATIGSLIAAGLLSIIVSAAPAELLGGGVPETNWSILLIGVVGIALLTSAFGVGPILLASTGWRGAVMILGRAPMARGGGGHKAVVAFQLSVAMVFFVCAGLLGRTLGGLEARPLGFDPANLSVVSIRTTQFPTLPPTDDDFQPMFASWRHTEALLDSINRLPGVVASAGAASAPFVGSWSTIRVRAQGAPALTSPALAAQTQAITQTYFGTMGIRLLSGRDFADEDRRRTAEERHRIVIVSAELERLLGGSAVGRHLREEETGVTFEIVGVVSNVKQRNYSDSDVPTLYQLSSAYNAIKNLVVRVAPGRSVSHEDIRGRIQEHDRSVLVGRTDAMEAVVSSSVAHERFRAALTTVFGGAALLLGAIGVYSVVARTVEERRREIGIRAAIGATPTTLTWMILGNAGAMVLIGLTAGLPASLAAAYLLRGFLFGVSPFEPTVILAGSALLTVVALAAAWIPARRAARIDPTLALKSAGTV